MKKITNSRTKSRKKQLAAGVLAAILGLFPWTSQLSAKEFNVGPGPTSDPHYATLAELAGAPGWATGSGSNSIVFRDAPPLYFWGDFSLTGTVPLTAARTSLLVDGTSVYYMRTTGIQTHVSGAGTGYGFLNLTPDNDYPQQRLTLRQVMISDFTNVAVSVYPTNSARTSFDIDMLSGNFHDNTQGINITYGTLRVERYSNRSRPYAPSFYGNGNTTTGNAPAAAAYGGGIYASNSLVLINQACFGVDPRDPGDVYSGNYAAQSGGAIYVTTGGRYTTRDRISLSEFYCNSAGVYGGGVYTNKNLDIYGTTFGQGNIYNTGVRTYSNSASQGGAVYFYGSDAYARSLNIGAVITRDGNNQVQYQRSNFSFNDATDSGGAIRFVGTHASITSLNINDSILNANHAATTNGFQAGYGKMGGGAIYATNATVNIGTAALDPISIAYEGDFSSVTSSSVAAGNVTMRDNVASYAGGAINIAGTKLAEQNPSRTAILNVGVDDGSISNVFYSNRAGLSTNVGTGGAIYAANANVNIYAGTRFTSSHAELDGDDLGNGNSAQWGGAIAVHGLVSDVDIRFTTNIYGSTFLHNRATDRVQENETDPNAYRGNGGAIWVEGSKLYLEGSVFGNLNDDPKQVFGNTAYEHGGAIYLSKIIMNTASGESAPSNGREHEIVGSQFYRNAAQSYIGNVASNGIVNHVQTSGGAIHVSQVHARVSGGNLFQENTATMREYDPANAWKHGGGAISVSDVFETGATEEGRYFKAQLSVEDATFTQNSAGSGYTMGAGGLAAANNADKGGGSGGAILSNNANLLEISDSTFTGNTAWAYRNGADNPVFATTTGLQNDAGGYGGAIMILRNLENDGSIINPDVPYYSVADRHFVTDSTFIGNVAENFGGAIAAVTVQLQNDGTHGTEMLQVTVDGSGLNGQTMFEGNKALVGGAVYGYSSTVDIQNAVFHSNSAEEVMSVRSRTDGKGGAIAMEGGDVAFGADPAEFLGGVLLIDNSVFTVNTATAVGGAVYVNLATTTITDSIFGDADNVTSSDYTDRNKAVQGGAIALYQSADTGAAANANVNVITDTNFYGNIARDYEVASNNASKGVVRGGAILVHQTSATIAASTTDGRVEFIGNRAERNTNAVPTGELDFNGGGAIAVYSNDANFNAVLNVGNTDFTDNRARGNGGAIHSVNATLVDIQNSTFDRNIANQYREVRSGGDGGAIAIYRTNANIPSNHRILTTEFTGNLADTRGGAIYIQGAGTAAAALAMVDIGAIRTGQPDPDVAKSLFSGNEAWEHGGAIYAQNGDLYVSNTDFDSNRAASASGNSTDPPTATGGAIALNGGRLTVTDRGTSVSRTTFTNNLAEFRGGALWVGGGAVAEITNTAFGTQTALVDADDNPVLDANGQPILVVGDGNQAMQGGAIYYDGGVNRIVTSEFYDNKATGTSTLRDIYGGAVAVENGASLEVLGSTFNGNLVSPTGLTDPNKVFGGGAIAVIGGTLSTGNQANARTTFTDNEADGNGGAIYGKDALLTINADLNGNRANSLYNGQNYVGGGLGGAVYATGATTRLTTESANFTANEAESHGGGVYAAGVAAVTLTDSNFQDNTSGGLGGAVAIHNAGTLTVEARTSDSIFTGNSDSTGMNDLYLRNTASTFTADADRTIMIGSGLETDSTVLKNGAGLLTIAADSNITHNGRGAGSSALTVDAGTLNIGTYVDASTGEKVGAIVTVTGDTYMASGTTLAVSLNDIYAVGGGNEAALYTNEFLLAAGTRPKITVNEFTGTNPVGITDCGTYPGTGGAVYTIVQANVDIDKNAYDFVIGSGSATITEKDFLWYDEIRTADNTKQIQFGAGLVWDMEDPNSAHGTFFVDTGTVFTLNTNLKDNTVGGGAGNVFGWDGTEFTKTGNGTLVLGGVKDTVTGRNEYTGDTYVRGGTLAVTHSTGGVIDSVGDGDVIISSGATFQVGAYGITCSSEGTTVVTATLENALTGSGNFAVAAGTGGVVTINQANSYTGLTTVKNGTLRLTNMAGTGGNTSDRIVQIDPAGFFEIDLGAGSDTLNMQIRGDGSLVKGGTGTITVSRGNDAYHGTTIIKGGSLVADSVNSGVVDALGDGDVQFVANASDPSTLVLRQAGTFGNRITGDGNVLLDSGRMTVLTNGRSDYTGSTTLADGTDLTVTHVNATGKNVSATDSGGAVQLDRADSVLYFDVTADDQTYHKKITGAGSVVKLNDNTLTLSNGNSDFRGGTTIEAGELVITNVGAAGSGNVNVGGGATFQIAAAGTFGNTIVGSSTDNEVVINPGAGNTTTITGNNTYAGKTTVQSGTAKITQNTGTGENLSGRIVEIGSGATLELADGVRDDYNKKLTGDGTLVKSSSSDVTLTGDNEHRYTHVKNGRLFITQSSGLGSGLTTLESDTTLGLRSTLDGSQVANNVRLNGSATILTEQGTVALTGDISGPGSLKKTGSGWLALDGTSNTFSGGLTISGGGVVVTNQDALGTGRVNNSASLELNLTGNHTLRTDISSDAGTFIKSGTGRLDVDHVFNTASFQMTGGTLAVDLGNAYVKSTNGFLISNSTLLGKYSGSDGLHRGEENGTRFLALDGANAYSFDKYGFESLAHVDWRVVTEGDKLYYELWTKSFVESYGNGLSYNANQAADGVDRLPENDPINTALKKLTDSDDIVRAFSQLHGEVYKSALYAEADLQRNFNEILLRRTIPCEHCYQFKGFRGQERPRTRELWAVVGGGGNFRTSFDQFSGYSIGRWGVAAGLEQLFDRNFYVGAAISYDQADMSLRNLSSKDNFYAFRVAGYTSYTYEDWSINGFLGYAKNWHDVRRNIDFMDATATSKFNDDVWTFGAEFRKLYHINTMDFIPSIGLNYVHVSAPAVVEGGAGAASLYVARDKYGSCKIPIGFRLNSRFDIQGVLLKPELRMFYVAEAGDAKIRGTTAFASDPGVGFLVDAGVRSRHAIRIGLGLDAKLFERMSIGVNYDGEITNKYSRHDVGGNMTVRW